MSDVREAMEMQELREKLAKAERERDELRESSKKLIPAIICGGSEGRAVVFGWVERLPQAGEAVTIHDARMVLYWPASCGGLFGLATNGPKDGLRLTSSVARVSDMARQVVAVTEAAASALQVWPNA